MDKISWSKNVFTRGVWWRGIELEFPYSDEVSTEYARLVKPHDWGILLAKRKEADKISQNASMFKVGKSKYAAYCIEYAR